MTQTDERTISNIRRCLEEAVPLIRQLTEPEFRTLIRLSPRQPRDGMFVWLEHGTQAIIDERFPRKETP